MPSDRRRTSANSALACAACSCLLLLGCASFRSPAGPALPGSSASQGPLTKSEAQAAIQRIDEVRDQAQCSQAMTLWQEGKTEEGRKLLEQVLVRNPSQPLARRLLADLALERGDTDEAERLLVELVRQQPDDQAARASLAWLYESQGREAEASALFEQLDQSFLPPA
jgi:predicted Zn-dependent protease